MKKTCQQPEIQTTALVVCHHLLVGSDTTINVNKDEEIEENFSRQQHYIWDESENESDDEF